MTDININSVRLAGRLARDAELKFTASRTAICNISIACNKKKKNGDQWEDEANFFDVVLFGEQWVSLHQDLKKGKQIDVSGNLKQDRWQTPEGQNRSKVVIVADTVKLIGGGGNGAPH
jgi:single-strand DNA-binding protein